MKARVKATGEILEVLPIKQYTNEYDQLIIEYRDADGIIYTSFELDFYLEDNTRIPDYWTRLEHQYAGMAMQGFLASGMENTYEYIAEFSANQAHALVEKLKKEEEK